MIYHMIKSVLPDSYLIIKLILSTILCVELPSLVMRSETVVSSDVLKLA